MKKLVVILLTILFVTGIYVPCFADDNPSPTVPEDIVIVDDDDSPEAEKPSIIVKPTEPKEPDKEPEEEKYDIEIEVHSYQFIDEVKSEEARKELKEAYEQISSLDDVSKLVPGQIEEIAHSLGADTSDLVVRDLFDVSAFMNGKQIDQNENNEYSFTLKANNLENFVCLLVYHNNEWQVVDNVEVLVEQSLLKVITKKLSPFAIVVATKYEYNNTLITPCGGYHNAIIIVTTILFIIAQFIRRKDDNNKNRNILIRDILCLISLILSIIFYILGNCKYDIYALIVDIVIVIIIFIYSHPFKKDSDNE